MQLEDVKYGQVFQFSQENVTNTLKNVDCERVFGGRNQEGFVQVRRVDEPSNEGYGMLATRPVVLVQDNEDKFEFEVEVWRVDQANKRTIMFCPPDREQEEAAATIIFDYEDVTSVGDVEGDRFRVTMERITE